MLIDKRGSVLIACPQKIITDNPSLPEGLNAIGEKTLAGIEIHDLKVPENIKYLGTFSFAGAQIDELQLEGVEKIDTWAFDRSLIKSIKLPDSLTEIGEYAFNVNENLLVIELPQSLKLIGYDAFSNEPRGRKYKVVKNSYAEKYCKEKGFKYETIDEQ